MCAAAIKRICQAGECILLVYRFCSCWSLREANDYCVVQPTAYAMCLCVGGVAVVVPCTIHNIILFNECKSRLFYARRI